MWIHPESDRLQEKMLLDNDYIAWIGEAVTHVCKYYTANRFNGG